MFHINPPDIFIFRFEKHLYINVSGVLSNVLVSEKMLKICIYLIKKQKKVQTQNFFQIIQDSIIIIAFSSPPPKKTLLNKYYTLIGTVQLDSLV